MRWLLLLVLTAPLVRAQASLGISPIPTEHAAVDAAALLAALPTEVTVQGRTIPLARRSASPPRIRDSMPHGASASASSGVLSYLVSAPSSGGPDAPNIPSVEERVASRLARFQPASEAYPWFRITLPLRHGRTLGVTVPDSLRPSLRDLVAAVDLEAIEALPIVQGALMDPRTRELYVDDDAYRSMEDRDPVWLDSFLAEDIEPLLPDSLGGHAVGRRWHGRIVRYGVSDSGGAFSGRVPTAVTEMAVCVALLDTRSPRQIRYSRFNPMSGHADDWGEFPDCLRVELTAARVPLRASSRVPTDAVPDSVRVAGVTAIRWTDHRRRDDSEDRPDLPQRTHWLIRLDATRWLRLTRSGLTATSETLAGLDLRDLAAHLRPVAFDVGGWNPYGPGMWIGLAARDGEMVRLQTDRRNPMGYAWALPGGWSVLGGEKRDPRRAYATPGRELDPESDSALRHTAQESGLLVIAPSTRRLPEVLQTGAFSQPNRWLDATLLGLDWALVGEPSVLSVDRSPAAVESVEEASTPDGERLRAWTWTWAEGGRPDRPFCVSVVGAPDRDHEARAWLRRTVESLRVTRL